MDLTLTSEALAAMRAHAARAHPRECCGILYGKPCGQLYGTGAAILRAEPAANVHPDPETHFEIDPQALVDAHRAARAGGPQVAGYYHSHPNGRAEPSATDRAAAAGDGRVWAIVAGEVVTLWRDDRGGFAPLSYLVQSA